MPVIHYYEAWLVTLAILVRHFYGTAFRPTVYPMNTARLAGRMSRELCDREHPDGPRLKSRTCMIRYEEDGFTLEPADDIGPHLPPDTPTQAGSQLADRPSSDVPNPNSDKKPPKAPKTSSVQPP